MSRMNLNADQYTDLCNLIEHMWAVRRKKNYTEVPDIDELPNFVSSQSRAMVNAIQKILWKHEESDVEELELTPDVVARAKQYLSK